MSADTATSTQPLYEMLGSESCKKALPLNPIVRELRFGRFITLAESAFASSGAISRGTRKTVLPLHFINVFLARRGRDAFPSRPPFAELEAVALIQRDEGPVLTIDVSNIADLLSKKSVTIRGEIGEVSLTEGAVKQLLAGASVLVPLRGIRGHTSVRLDASRAKDVDGALLPATHVVSNLHGFLADPAVVDTHGRRVALKLLPDQVRDLLNNRSVQVTSRGESVTVVPPVNSPDSRRGPFTGTLAMRIASGDNTRDTAVDVSREFQDAIRDATITTTDSGRDLLDAESSPQLGFYVPYVQTWTLLGYSRGTLLNSIALAPQEETTIELFSWDKRTNALEQTSASEAEQNIESVDTTKDTTQILKELTHDTNFHADASTHMDINVQMTKAVGGTFGGMAGAGGSNDVKEVAKRTTDLIHESTRKAALRVRASRQSKVSETHDYGSEQRTTRKIRNVNMCRSLNLDYFEILANYDVGTTCLRQQAELVVLFALKPYPWSRKIVRKFEPTLKAVLLDRAFSSGFEASRLLAARDEAFKAVCERSRCDDERVPQLTDSAEFAALREATYSVLRTFVYLRAWSYDTNIISILMVVAPPNPDNAPGDRPQMTEGVRRWAFSHRMQSLQAGLWSALLSLIGGGLPASASVVSESTIRQLHTAIPSAAADGTGGLAGIMTVDDEGRNELIGAVASIASASGLYKDIADKQLDDLERFLQVSIPGFDPAAMLTRFVTHVIVELAGKAADAAAIGLAAQAVDSRVNLGILDDMGLLAAIAAFQDAYKAWTEAKDSMLKQSEKYATALDNLASTRNDQLTNAFPLSTVADAREREDALLMHLEEYSDYYRFAIYQAQLVSGKAKVPTTIKKSSGLISPNAMGLVDGMVAFPVDLDGAIAADPKLIDELRSFLNSQIRNNTDLDAGPPVLPVSLPTPGITLETRLGACCSCEDFIEESRKIELRQRKAAALQAELEAKRLELRLAPETRNLDDPSPHRHEPTLTIKLEQQPPPPAPGTTPTS